MWAVHYNDPKHREFGGSAAHESERAKPTWERAAELNSSAASALGFAKESLNYLRSSQAWEHEEKQIRA